MQLLRDTSTHVTAYNEGLVVFLYDDASSTKIRETAPTILEGFGEDDATDPKLASLAKEGTLVVFELEGDDELSIEVAVGDPLSTEELSGGRWLRPQHARLALPSGDLRIECYNNLQFDEYTEDEDPAPISLPPGDYKLTLYRSNVFSYEDDEMDLPHAWQVITLTPEAGPDMQVETGMLRFPVGD